MEGVKGVVLEGASAETKGTLLDDFEFGDFGGGSIRKPNRCSIGENRTDEGIVGLEHCLLLVSPGCGSMGFEDF